MRFALLMGLLAFALVSNSRAADENANPSKPKPIKAKSSRSNKANSQQLFTGKVVMLKAALLRRGIKSADEFKNQVVLETASGDLIPIVPDWRGRAFYQDKRLRDRKVDLIGRRKKGVPYLQVLMVFTYDARKTRQYTDYWCDICKIAMYEIKPCDCCQDKTRLRFKRRVLPYYVKDIVQSPETRVQSGK